MLLTTRRLARALRAALAAVAITASWSGSALPAPAPEDSPAAALAGRLFAALNSKDNVRMEAFAAGDCDPATPPAERAQRLSRLAERGAPFKLVRIVGLTAAALTGLMEDANGETFTFVLNLTAGPGAPRMASLQLGPPEAADAKPPQDYTGWTDLRALAASIRTDTGSPAIGVAVVHDGKTEIVTDGVREIGKPETVGADEPWSVGSVGKPLCSTIIGKLIEMGKLRFDMTLAEALPGMPMRPGYEGVTLEQVMHHRSGLPEDLGMRRPQVEAIVGAETDPVRMRDRYVRDILAREPAAKPGAQFVYSNAGYAILAHIAELQSGKAYEDVLRDVLFTPLGLAHSYIGSATYPKLLPSGHVPVPNGLEAVNFRGPLEILFAGAGGGIYMSAGDLARFGAMHLAGLQGKDGFLKAATVERLHRAESEGGPEGRGYACGWGVQNRPGLEPWHGHNGSNGTFRAELAVFPQANLVVAAMVNRGGESEPSPPLQAVLAAARRYAHRD